MGSCQGQAASFHRPVSTSQACSGAPRGRPCPACHPLCVPQRDSPCSRHRAEAASPLPGRGQTVPRWPWGHLSDGAAAEGLRSVRFACAGDALRPAGRQPAVGRPSAVHAACFQCKLHVTQSGTSGHATECKWLACPVFTGTKAQQLASVGHVLGAVAPRVCEAGGFLRVPRPGRVP